MWWLIRKALFLFDAEDIHHFTQKAISLYKTLLGKRVLQISVGGPAKKTSFSNSMGRIGLAAGFDKNAEWLPTLPCFGFHFAEIGTVTPRPQSGNDRPRLFRDGDKDTLFNRMGFNNLGAAIVSERLAKVRPDLPSGFRVGINIGKNKNTPNEHAHQDYAHALKHFDGLVDYAVINVSSPNTQGLRDLQTLESLLPIVESVLQEQMRWTKNIPVYVKLAPELQSDTLATLISGLEKQGVEGFILTNTLGGEWMDQGKRYTGGLSGRPLTSLSMARLKDARSLTGKTLFSVGGILSTEEALARIQAGADHIQVYSGWILKGPAFIWKLRRELDKHPSS